MKIHSLSSELWLPVPIDRVFDFFADASNLQKITPPWLQFKILTPTPLAMRRGTFIDYRLKLRGIPLRWKSEITAWEPPYRFIDEQRKGPYRLWVHEHLFREEREGTLIADRVQYAIPGGEWIHRFLVKPDLQKIFAYRKASIEAFFKSEG